MWDGGRNLHLFTRNNLEKLQFLIDAISEFGLQMTLPKDIPTLCSLSLGNYIRPDNVFVSSMLISNLIQCDTWPEKHPARTDHTPVVSHFNISMET